MKKIYLFLLALVCAVGAWAEVPALKTSTDDAKVYYTIKNYRSNKFAQWKGDDVQLGQTSTLDDACYWYLLANGDDGYTLCNKATGNKYAGHSSFTADGAKTYIIENPHRAGYWCVSLIQNLSDKCWDDQGQNKDIIGYWHPSASDNEGTSWIIEESTGDVNKDALKDLLAVAKASVGSNPGCYPQSAIDAAQAVFDTEDGDYAAAKTALQQAFVLPVEGKYYRITSAFSAFENQQHVTKSIYVDNAGHVMWKSTDRTDMSMLWEIYNDGSKYVFKNRSTGTFISTYADNNFSMGDEANDNTNFTWFPGGICNISVSGGNFHANGHNSGNGAGSNIIQYGNGAGGASAWYVVEVDPAYEQAYGNLQNKLSELPDVGNKVGQYQVSGMSESDYVAAIEKAQAVLDDPSSSSDAYITALDELNGAIDMANITFTLNMPEAGKYYRILNASKGNLTDNMKPIINEGSGVSWGNFEADVAKQVWTIAPEGDKFVIQSLRDEKYFGTQSAQYQTHPMSANKTFATLTSLGQRQFNIKIDGSQNCIHAQGDGKVVCWGGGLGTASAWYIEEVTDKTEDELAKMQLQAFYDDNVNRFPEIDENAKAVVLPNEFTNKGWNKESLKVLFPNAQAALDEADATADELKQHVQNIRSVRDINNSVNYELASVPYTFGAEYGTLISPVPASIPQDMEVYTCEGVNEKNELNLVNAASIEANIPYVVKGTQGDTYQLIGWNRRADLSEDTKTVGALTGVYAEDFLAPVNSYVLQNKTTGLAFYKVFADNEPTVKPGRCYLTVDASEAPAFFFGGNGTTDGIQSIETTVNNGTVYDLSGRSVKKMAKGLYIVNGKKVLVK